MVDMTIEQAWRRLEDAMFEGVPAEKEAARALAMASVVGTIEALFPAPKQATVAELEALAGLQARIAALGGQDGA